MYVPFVHRNDEKNITLRLSRGVLDRSIFHYYLSKLSEPAKYFACQVKLEITESEIIEHEDYLH